MTVGSWCRDRERRSARLTPRTGSSCGESYDRCSEAAGVKSTQKYTTCIRDGLVNTKVVGGVDKCEPNLWPWRLGLTGSERPRAGDGVGLTFSKLTAAPVSSGLTDLTLTSGSRAPEVSRAFPVGSSRAVWSSAMFVSGYNCAGVWVSDLNTNDVLQIICQWQREHPLGGSRWWLKTKKKERLKSFFNSCCFVSLVFN